MAQVVKLLRAVNKWVIELFQGYVKVNNFVELYVLCELLLVVALSQLGLSKYTHDFMFFALICNIIIIIFMLVVVVVIVSQKFLFCP